MRGGGYGGGKGIARAQLLRAPVHSNFVPALSVVAYAPSVDIVMESCHELTLQDPVGEPVSFPLPDGSPSVRRKVRAANF